MKLAPKIKDIKNPNIPKDTQGTYPKAWTQINSLSDRLNDRKYAAYKKRCHADKATVDGAFNRFSPPDLVIVYFGPGKDGQINKDTGGNPELNEILINAFQKD